MSQEGPVFIHSLFRSGSTYLFNRFRHSPHGYWCYQEPLNEFLLNAASAPEKLLELQEDTAHHLRHPALDKPYFYEFHALAEQIGQAFRPEFSYKDYFSSAAASAESLCRYLRILIDGSRGRPMFQECRSCGRVELIRRCIGGRHIFLWRNPWDQWWSYKVDSHFEICNLQILVSPSAPPAFVELRKLLGFAPINSEVVNLVAERLDAAGSYMLFFALWCHAMLVARKACDLEINIDSLSRSEEYQTRIMQRLRGQRIEDIDLSDCSIPISIYGSEDRSFFQEQEALVIELFSRHGCSKNEIEEMQLLRQTHDVHDHEAPAINFSSVKDIDRIRRTARRLESELAGAQRELGQRNRFVSAKEAERQQLETALGVKEAERQQLETALGVKEAERQQLEAALGVKEAERQQLEAALGVKEAERQQLEMTLGAKEQELGIIFDSLTWRAGAPARAMGRMLQKFFRKFSGE